jgi:hypothetical protein
MSHLRISFITVSAILLLLSGVQGLDFSMGISNGMNGASESVKLNTGLESAFASSTVASPGYYSTNSNGVGDGDLDFNQSFESLDGGEQVRLIAKMSDSVYHAHNFVIEKEAYDQIRVSESLVVDQGKDIECSAQAWNSLRQSAKVGIKIPVGSLTGYSNYGNATDTSVTAYQTAIIPKRTLFDVFAEAKRGYSTQSTSSTIRYPVALKAETTSTVTTTKSSTRSILRLA